MQDAFPFWNDIIDRIYILADIWDMRNPLFSEINPTKGRCTLTDTSRCISIYPFLCHILHGTIKCELNMEICCIQYRGAWFLSSDMPVWNVCIRTTPVVQNVSWIQKHISVNMSPRGPHSLLIIRGLFLSPTWLMRKMSNITAKHIIIIGFCAIFSSMSPCCFARTHFRGYFNLNFARIWKV